MKNQTITLNKHMELVIERCKSVSSDLRSIVLYGSYGRDEGSWIIQDNGTHKPYNDYDILLVQNTNIGINNIELIRKRLAEEIGIKWVDIGQITTKGLRKLRPSIYNYDLKYASKVIHGDNTVLEQIPEIKSAELKFAEGEKLYFTRLYTLIGSLDERGLDQELAGEASRFFRNQMAKAVLAVVDVLLLAKGAYDASYRKRVERVAELYREKEDFLELSHWALQEKLRPQAPSMKSREVRSMYESVHHHYLHEMYRALSLRFGKYISGPKDLEFCMKGLPLSLLKRLYWLLKFRDLRMERQVSVMLAQSYIAAAWKPDRINEEPLRKGVALLRQVDDRLSTELTWDEVRLEAARLRMEV